MRPRLYHTATVFGSGPDCRQLVLWGGMEKWLSDNVRETILLNFGEDVFENNLNWDVHAYYLLRGTVACTHLHLYIYLRKPLE